MAKREKSTEFPQDLLMEILLRLRPLRSVFRFRCVSRQWNEILNGEYFLNLYSQHYPYPHPNSSPSILFFHSQTIDGKSLISISFNGSPVHHTIKLHNQFPSDYTPFKLSTTCNGLVCIVPTNNFVARSIVVCNPLTLEYITLPPYNFRNNSYNYSVGLGFSPSSKEYKVVCIATAEFDSPAAVAVYTVGGGKPWKEVYNNVDFEPHSDAGSILYLDGKIYWAVHNRRVYQMFSFDVEREEPHSICQFPENRKWYPLDFRLGETENYGVSLFIHVDQCVEMWVLKNDADQHDWDMIHKIELPRLPTRTLCRILSVSELSDGGLLVLLKDSTVKFKEGKISYRVNPQNICYTLRPSWCVCQAYKPSLVSLESSFGSACNMEKLSNLQNRELLPPLTIELPTTP